MKNKIFIASLLLSAVASIATAQNKEKYFSEKAKDNIFVSFGVGAQMVTNPSNFDYGFGKSITPLINISVGKLFTPVWGIRAQVAGWSGKLNTQYPFEGYNDLKGTEKWYKNKETFFGFNGDVMLNLTNLFCGYNENRKWEFGLFGGPTLNITKAPTAWNIATKSVNVPNADGSLTIKQELDPANSYAYNDKVRLLVGASLGLSAKYNVNKYWALDFEARGTVTPSVFGKLSDANEEGIVGVSVGTTYTFGGKKFIPASAKVDKNAINDAVNNCRAEVERLQNELANQKPVVKEVVKEVTKETLVANPLAVFFKIGSAKIDDYGKVNIQLIAEAMKANSKEKYKIAGYCDKETGSNSANQVLSEKRAQAVYDALVSEGVNKDQLELVGFGGTENMFGHDYLNRVVILK